MRALSTSIIAIAAALMLTACGDKLTDQDKAQVKYNVTAVLNQIAWPNAKVTIMEEEADLTNDLSPRTIWYWESHQFSPLIQYGKPKGEVYHGIGINSGNTWVWVSSTGRCNVDISDPGVCDALTSTEWKFVYKKVRAFMEHHLPPAETTTAPAA